MENCNLGSAFEIVGQAHRLPSLESRQAVRLPYSNWGYAPVGIPNVECKKPFLPNPYSLFAVLDLWFPDYFATQKMPDGFWPSGISMCSSKD
jgi:hypothetical protein